MKKTLLGIGFLFIVVGMNGCASKYMAKIYSTGAVGCTSDKINIVDEKLDIFGYTTWRASCKGKNYICKHHDDEGTNCTEVVK